VSVARGAALVTAGILVSRLAGLARQRVVAHVLGTGEAADALAAALRVGNLTQNLLGEGTLSASFIPVYARLRKDDPAAARAFALAALGLLTAAVAALSAVFVLAAPWITAVVAPGFEGAKLALTIDLVRIVFPMTAMLVLAAWGLGVLNAHRRFFLPYAAPVLWSAAQIAAMLGASAALGASARDGGAVAASLARAAAWGALVGAALQVAVLLPAARACLGGLGPTLDRGAPGVREALGRLPAALLGRGVIQLSGLVDTALVTLVGAGANATFAYAQTIYLLPMSLLGTGEAAASLPEQAERSADRDPASRAASMGDGVGRSLARVLTLAIPAAAVFLVLGRDVTNLILRSGSFDAGSASLVAPVLAAYAPSLVANASSRVLGATCWALGEVSRPARYATVRVVVSTLVALALLRPLGVVGVVLGAAVAGWTEMAMLARLVRKHVGSLGLARVPLTRILAASAIAVGSGEGIGRVLATSLRDSTLGAAIVLGAAGAVFLAAARLLGLGGIRALLGR
jgi:putative peptidoglycan lipid II flippase